MVVNTSLRSINSASEHGNMATPRSAYSSVMQFKLGINNLQLNHSYRYTLFNRSSTEKTYISIFTSTWS